MLNLTKQNEQLRRISRSPIALIRRLRRDENGGITIFTLFLLVTMLVLGGMAVDFMRFESKRVLLQSVSDRAVLSAAELDQTRDPDVIVEDFFRTAGYEDAVITRLVTDAKVGNREVEVSSEIDIDTFFLRLVGIDTLSAPATSGAIEGTGKVEVSLILDISGSMGNWVASEGDTRMGLLQDAATDFIEDLLLEKDGDGNVVIVGGEPVKRFEDQVSVSLIAYSQHVSVGDDLYKALNTEHDVIFKDGRTFQSPESTYDSVPPIPPQVNRDTRRFVNPSRCVDFLDAEYDVLAFNDTREYEQVEFFEHYNDGSSVTEPVCPKEDFEGIIPFSQDATALIEAIDDYRPTTFTSIHLGMKWGTLLLDPSMRETLARIPTLDPAFSGLRPADHLTSSTKKYIVLMTDGENVRGRRIDKVRAYHNYNWRNRWSNRTLYNWIDNDDTDRGRGWFTNYDTTASEQDTWLQTQCDLAEAQNIVIYTIAMGAGAGSNGETQMTNCASEDGGAFSTNFTGASGEPGIDEIFNTIAQQITALRLSL